jgi:glycosyltransferase involved in cell wall biosynthesis
MINKLKCVVYAPVDTYSGYGANSRDKVKALIELYEDKWDIKIISCRWGNTPQGFIRDHEKEWGFLINHINPTAQLSYQPDIMIWITVPNEAQIVGKWNCLFTAGIETTICDASWIQGCNRMDLNIVSSNHAKNVFVHSKFQKLNNHTKAVEENIELSKPVEVLFEGADLEKYKQLDIKDVKSIDLSNIKENWCYLFVGHWLQGEVGEDRKNVGLLVKAFLETFKNKPNPPALILKTSGANCSYMDRDEILKKIHLIKKTVNSKKLPNIYLLHGNFNDSEINELYNHPKVKSMISLTKGEGFGRPLLEFSLSGKPIITTAYSGHLDFLNPEFTKLIPGNLTQIHSSAVIPNMLIAESQWFSPDHGIIGMSLIDVFENYKGYKEKAKRQAYYSKTNFSFEKMKEKLKEIFDKNMPLIPTQIELKLPKLEIPKTINLPKLEKIK